jgi:hypothetical protein
MAIFYLKERNLPPEGYDKGDLESKGFYAGGLHY